MPENIPLLEPTVLRGVVEKLTTPEDLVLSSRVPRTPHAFPTATWDVISGSRSVARPNVPNSEAHIVPQLGMSQQSAAFIYLREKKVFTPTTLHWLRSPGTTSNRQRAEAAVLREVRDLNLRFDNFLEWALWQALTGRLILNGEDVKADIDYKLPTTHKPTISTSWATGTPVQLVDSVTALKQLVIRDGRVQPREAFATTSTMARVFRTFANSNASLLSDRAKDEYYRSGTLPGFLQLDWKLVDSSYDMDNGGQAGFVANDALFIGNYTDNRPIEVLEGPSADDEAPEGHTGKFSKTWKEKDPSARQYLIEWNVLPIITRPEQMVYVEDVAPGSDGGFVD